MEGLDEWFRKVRVKNFFYGIYVSTLEIIIYDTVFSPAKEVIMRAHH